MSQLIFGGGGGGGSGRSSLVDEESGGLGRSSSFATRGNALENVDATPAPFSIGVDMLDVAEDDGDDDDRNDGRDDKKKRRT